ncbi:MarR family winged helix-turn-helix transcriptional regulator [Wenyingzhuangia sp. 2_MG-2023]|uniref:MarR family winged helix-turn-helix transcriptional regulator n=1 Tax=Wenyingzhuangia sp. 2_MG-2023 TaxID=3062639 RepID=UPI0026E47AC3|nr:MarR family transcriptional regulator [Wenyingzhuangia sp. 2_MG-2023]MDO6738051.1 MarR family transcriptional regulator [Wenyingzhuangia sp. 2_MG-2023]MDO6802595.1 MarR family transcriptional regulator [Wenyingzhuangia sp. 1_MG-2023]
MGEFSKEVNATFDSDYVKAMLNLKYTANYINTVTNKELEPYQISSAQYNILRILRGAKKPITMKLVKERMIEKSPNTTRLTDKLCEKELIERVRCENDRRAVYVSITEKGLQLLSQIVFAEIPKLMQQLTEEEAVLLNNLLDKVRG